MLVAVWEGGTITVRELHDRVSAPLGLVYTTTARVVDRLCAKGLISREKDGRLFRYKASAARKEVERARLTKTLSSVLAEGPRPGLLDELTRTIKVLRRTRS